MSAYNPFIHPLLTSLYNLQIDDAGGEGEGVGEYDDDEPGDSFDRPPAAEDDALDRDYVGDAQQEV